VVLPLALSLKNNTTLHVAVIIWSEPRITAIFYLMKKITIYGIKNCDTMKKTFSWFEENNITYDFHDYKKLGIDEKSLKTWISKLGLATVINTKGTTYKQLTEEEKLACNAENTAVTLLLQKTSMIKRPLIVMDKNIWVGFEPTIWEQKIKK